MKKAFVLGLIFLACGCGSRVNRQTLKPIVTVSILPLKYFVEQIGGTDFEVKLMVPPGASPETFEPAPRQMRELANSQAFFMTGLLDFERAYIPALQENVPNVHAIDLSNKLEIIAGDACCTSHGADPHIWLSAKNARVIADEILQTLQILNPDSAAKYTQNHQAFQIKIDSLDRYLTSNLKPGQKFMIYHPSLAYLSRDYGLEQIALEHDGKEPSAQHFKEIVDLSREYQIQVLLYQSQLNPLTVESLAKELNIRPKPFDPLAENWLDNLFLIGNLLKQSNAGVAATNVSQTLSK